MCPPRKMRANPTKMSVQIGTYRLVFHKLSDFKKVEKEMREANAIDENGVGAWPIAKFKRKKRGSKAKPKRHARFRLARKRKA
jgi:hypothetical protein